MGPLGHCLLTLPYLLIHSPQLVWFLFFLPLSFGVNIGACKGFGKCRSEGWEADPGTSQSFPFARAIRGAAPSLVVCPSAPGTAAKDVSGFVTWL